ncbi:hypothetical protein VNI00_005231 [Paramarasmius palmivorus]|uniref:DUF6534 domain-containing protein n=1 Tax=Paramarasmius palmivorus TaxID=297713 RepID=A0AAW0DF14_9AGAR
MPHLYYMAFPNDRRLAKVLAYGTFIFEVVQTALTTQSAYSAYASGFGNLETLLSLQTTWLAVPVMGAAIAFVGQLFFAWRIYVLSKSLSIPCIVTATLEHQFSITSLVCGIFTGIYALEGRTVTHIKTRDETIFAALWCTSSALCDLIIAASMTFYLLKIKNGFRRTEAMITKLIALVIETGTMTAAVVSVFIVLYLLVPQTTYYATVSLIIPKTYANTIFVILNSRMQIKNGRNSDSFAALSGEGMTIPSFLLRESGPTLPCHVTSITRLPQTLPTNSSASSIPSPVTPLTAYVTSTQDLLRFPTSRFSAYSH